MKISRTFRREKAGLYIHIPFCIRKCIYCNFNSSPDCSEKMQSGYFDGLKEEMRQFWKSVSKSESLSLWDDQKDAEQDQANVGEEERHVCGKLSAASSVSFESSVSFADTLFIGGGTPSSVDPALIEDLMEHIRRMEGKFPVSVFEDIEDISESKKNEKVSEKRICLLSEDAEITMECNPATVDLDSLIRYRKAGVNRLSIGVQSFHDEELKFLGRTHSVEEAERCFNDARQAGFDNINIDLIFGIPGSTAESWKETLQHAIALKPEHLSFYSLQIEEGTPLYELFRKDEVEQISDEENRRMYHDAIEILRQAGYHQYEISNAALPQKECRHNLKYWSMCDYAGFGVSAHSYFGGQLRDLFTECDSAADTDIKNKGNEEYSDSDMPGLNLLNAESYPAGVRLYNEDDISAYMEQMKLRKSKSRGYIPWHIHKNSLRDEISESLFTGLRKKEGISTSWFDEKFQGTGITFAGEFGQRMQSFIDDGYLIFDGERLRFTLKGFDISNYILAELI